MQQIIAELRSYFDWGLVFLASFLTCGGNLCLKQAKLQGDGMLSFFFLAGLFLLTMSMLSYSTALTRLPLSAAYPAFAGLGFVLVALFSNFLFQEHLSTKQWVGMVLTLIGIGCIF